MAALIPNSGCGYICGGRSAGRSATQPKTWEKYQQLYPSNSEKAFIDKLAGQLGKADPQASDKNLRTFGTLGVLRHELRDKSASFKLCQFKPEHSLNPETQAMYEGNILRYVLMSRAVMDDRGRRPHSTQSIFNRLPLPLRVVSDQSQYFIRKSW